jgi:4-hydroxy-tetrahydrodipicolinate synthase
MNPSKLRGLGVAMVTPFNEDESVDFVALEKLTNHLIDGGADYLVVLGTTGESPTVTAKEQREIKNFIVKINKARLPIMLGIGGNSTRSVVNAIKEADLEGVDSILSVVPYYNRPVQEGIYKHYVAIADASPVPVMLYNVPGRTSVNMLAETTLRWAQHKNIIGVKEASCSIEQIKAIIKDRPEGFLVVSGDDALTLPLIDLGGDGVISVVGNAFPAKFAKSIHQALEGNVEYAKELFYDVNKFVDYLFIDGNPPGIKALLAEMGIIKNFMRLPVVPATVATHNKLKELLVNFG